MSDDNTYTPNPPATNEHMGATEDNEWEPVRVPGSEQGTLAGRRPEGDPQGAASTLGEEAEEEIDAYEVTTGG